MNNFHIDREIAKWRFLWWIRENFYKSDREFTEVPLVPLTPVTDELLKSKYTVLSLIHAYLFFSNSTIPLQKPDNLCISCNYRHLKNYKMTFECPGLHKPNLHGRADLVDLWQCLICLLQIVWWLLQWNSTFNFRASSYYVWG